MTILVILILTFCMAATLTRPIIGLLIFMGMIYLRFQDIVPEVLGPFSLNVIGGVTVAGWLLSRNPMVKCPQNALMFGFMAAVALSLFQHPLETMKLEMTELLSKVIYFFLILNIVRTVGTARAFVGLWFGVIVGLAVWITYQTDYIGNYELLYEGRTQYYGIMGNPNDLAVVFVIMIPMAYFTLRESPSTRGKWLGVFAFLMLVYAMTATLSRGAILGMVGAMGVSILRDRRKVGALIIIILLVGVLDLYVADRFWSRVDSIDYANPDQSSDGRLYAWEAGMTMLTENPLMGVGKGAFTRHHPIAAHSAYVEVAAETGILGLAFWSMLILFTVKDLARAARMVEGQPSLRGLSIHVRGVEAGFVGYLVCAVFLSHAYSWFLFSFFGTAAALRRTTESAVAAIEQQTETVRVEEGPIKTFGLTSSS